MTIKAFRELWKQYGTTSICKKPLSEFPTIWQGRRFELVQWFGPLSGMFSMEPVRGKCSWRRGLRASEDHFLFTLHMAHENAEGQFIHKHRWVL